MKKHDTQTITKKKAYRYPQVRKLGSVRQLTLKMGSMTDGQTGHI